MQGDTKVIYASDAPCQPDWPTWLKTESEMAQSQHIIATQLEERKDAAIATSHPDTVEYIELHTMAFRLWQSLEYRFAASLKAWNGPVSIRHTAYTRRLEQAAALNTAMRQWTPRDEHDKRIVAGLFGISEI